MLYSHSDSKRPSIKQHQRKFQKIAIFTIWLVDTITHTEVLTNALHCTMM